MAAGVGAVCLLLALLFSICVGAAGLAFFS